MIKLITGLAICSLCLTGCVTPHAVSGDSVFTQKIATYPKLDQETQVKEGGLVHLHANYDSRFIYKLEKHFSSSFMLGRITATPDDHFSESISDGKTYFCSSRMIYSEPIFGPRSRACFTSSETGVLDKVQATPGAVPLTREISPPVSFTKEEMPFQRANSFLKRELIYDGVQEGNLLFTQKIYEQSLTTPNRFKPHIVKIVTLPAKIVIDGAEFTIVKFTGNNLSFKLDKSWQ